MILSEAIEAAKRILDGYPNGGRDASKGYIGALAATLGSYPKMVATACADPLRGIVRENKFLPTVADLVAWCEKRTEPLRGDVEREDRVSAQLALREEMARTGRLTYDELKDKYGDGKGGWGVDGVNDKPRWSTPSSDELRKICGDDAWDKLKPRIAAE